MPMDNIPAEKIVKVAGGWKAINHENALYILDRKKKDKSLIGPRTVFSLQTANHHRLKPFEIDKMMAEVTEKYELQPWTNRKVRLQYIYAVLSSSKNDNCGVSYKSAIKECYAKLTVKDKGASRSDDFIPTMQESSYEPGKGNLGIEKYIWSVTKDRKIKRDAIHEYRIEHNTETDSFHVIANGYTLQSGVAIFCAKTKEDCIEFIDQITM